MNLRKPGKAAVLPLGASLLLLALRLLKAGTPPKAR
jgi:hypothetical protein